KTASPRTTIGSITAARLIFLQSTFVHKERKPRTDPLSALGSWLHAFSLLDQRLRRRLLLDRALFRHSDTRAARSFAGSAGPARARNRRGLWHWRRQRNRPGSIGRQLRFVYQQLDRVAAVGNLDEYPILDGRDGLHGPGDQRPRRRVGQQHGAANREEKDAA